MLSSKNELEDSSLISALTVSNRWKLKRKKKSVNISVVTIFSFPSSFFFLFSLSSFTYWRKEKSISADSRGWKERKGELSQRQEPSLFSSLITSETTECCPGILILWFSDIKGLEFQSLARHTSLENQLGFIPARSQPSLAVVHVLSRPPAA